MVHGRVNDGHGNRRKLHWTRLIEPLGKFPSVFKAEVYVTKNAGIEIEESLCSQIVKH